MCLVCYGQYVAQQTLTYFGVEGEFGGKFRKLAHQGGIIIIFM